MVLGVWFVSLYVIGTVAVIAGTNCNESCPVWFNYNSKHDMCLCYPSYEGYITCNQEKQETYIHLGMAIGYQVKNGCPEAWVGYIPYIFPNNLVTNHLVIEPNDTVNIYRDILCESIHRQPLQKDIFCGKCKPQYGPALYSYGMQCAKCKKWPALPKYLALQILPISAIYAAVLIFKIDLTRPNMFHYIIFCNVITTVFRYSSYLSMSFFYSGGPLPVLMKITLTMSGIWSLDFFRFVVPPFCFSSEVKDSTIPFFEFYPPAYLLIVTLLIAGLIKLHNYRVKLILRLWRPVYKLFVLCKQNRDPWEALAHTYATFFLLYFGKTVSVALVTALTSSAISQNSTTPRKRLTVFYDPTVEYFDARHISILMAVFLTATVLIIPAVLLLTVFHTQLFQRFYHAKIGYHWQTKLRVFVRTLQNGYKDGSQGTRDYRPMAGGFFLSIIILCGVLILILRLATYTLNLPWPIGCVIFAGYSIMYGTMRPYKKRSSNNMAVIIYGVLVVLAIILCFTSQRSELFYRQRQALLYVGMFVISAVNFAYLGYLIWKIATYFVTYEQPAKWLKKIIRRKQEEEQGLLRSS